MKGAGLHAIGFIQDIAVIMLIAGMVTILCHRFRQPVVLGYIAVGVIIGPHTPPFKVIQDMHTIQILAELGIIFLLFALGLEFNLRKLSRVGVTAFLAAFAEIGLMIWLGYEIGLAFGWSAMDAIFLGAMLAISSTTIIIKALNELKLKNEKFAQLIFGILIVEDILAIGMIALLSGIAMQGTVNAIDAVATLGKLSLFMIVSLVIGLIMVPRLIAYVARFQSNEMLLVTVLGLCFGFCLLVIKLEYSIALGAFMIGAIMAEARQFELIERLIEPLRDMFSAIFFVTIGLLFDPAVLLNYALPVAVIAVAVIVGKVVSCSLGVFVAGYDGRTSMRVGMGMAQIGEFSFIIASLGISLKVTSEFLYPIVVAVSAITTLLTPYLIRLADPLTARLAIATPGPVAHVFSRYAGWLEMARPEGDRAIIATIVLKILLQVLVNCALVAAVFIAGAYFMTNIRVMMGTWIASEELQRSIVWGGALFISLPFLIAMYRKLHALSMLLAEVGIKSGFGGHLTAALRRVVTAIIPMASIVALLYLIGVFSKPIRPSTEWLLALMAGAAILAAILWKPCIRLYARLQILLIETLQRAPDDTR
jgi:monovalent cation:H+ antiporter-2, CPA2 family